MRFARIRSGLAESFEDATVIVLDSDGAVLYSTGDPDRPLYYRSVIKPFQALAAVRAGLDLPDEYLAVTCASHGGFPVHVGIVDAILSSYGLSSHDLRSPRARPSSRAAADLQITLGNSGPDRLFHNCSGKHAGWLAACVLRGWDVATYLNTDHPLQRSIIDIMADASGTDPEPVGVDGCGAPTLRGTVRGLARAFGRLGSDPELAPMARAMTRFGALVADNIRPDGRTGAWWGGPQKIGAAGLYAMTRGSFTIASKSHSGSAEVAIAAALAAAQRIGALTPAMTRALEPQIAPPVIGAGQPVGRLELIEA